MKNNTDKTTNNASATAEVTRKFRDVAIGQRFNFKSTFIVPTDYSTATWEKTGNRTYRHADGSDETRGRELARIYGYKYSRRDHRVGTINVEVNP
jgi:hypothetical protein